MSQKPPLTTLKKSDFESDQDVRWCPGCGDYAILATVQRTLAKLGVRKEETVFVSGIGCSSRFPYYMDTYGFHSIHGRAPAIATGLKLARPELSVWVITGDGDGLSIGGNHLLHALRRNVGIKILLFNNRIYGLTKGQYSPTSDAGTRAPSTPMGSLDRPINPVSFALGAGGTFIARVADTDAKLLGTILEAAHHHRGSALVEILQNCPVFNDGTWAEITDKSNKVMRQLPLRHGQPLLFGPDDQRGIRLSSHFRPEVVSVGPGEGQVAVDAVTVHDETAPIAFGQMLATMQHPDFPLPVGILRRSEHPAYDELVRQQVEQAVAARGRGKVEELLAEGLTWKVGPEGIPSS